MILPSPSSACAFLTDSLLCQGNPLGPVPYWEIGNEPYLLQQNTDLNRPPNETAMVINQFIPAMKAVDPSIMVGVPLSSSYINNVSVTDWVPLDYLSTVLQTLNVSFDFMAVHDGYMPLSYQPTSSDEEIYLAAMGAYKTVEQDMKSIRQALISYTKPDLHGIPFAMTEFNFLIEDLYLLYSTSYMGTLFSDLALEKNSHSL